MTKQRRFVRLAGVPLCGLLFLLGGCALTYQVHPPQPSSLALEGSADGPTTLRISDRRTAADKPLSVGRMKVQLVGLEDEMSFLRDALVAELGSRGLPVVPTAEGPADLELDVKTFRIRNHRSSGFSPYQTATLFAADLRCSGSARRIGFYFRIGKVPLVSMQEVQEPCYNLPLSLMVKEVAAKINRHCFGLQASAAVVGQIHDQITRQYVEDETFKQVFELGYSNNPVAREALTDLLQHEDAYMRVAAIGALGMVASDEDFESLHQLYRTTEDDLRLMALKAIGDLNTDQAQQFMRFVKASTEYEHHRIKEVVDLFLDDSATAALPDGAGTPPAETQTSTGTAQAVPAEPSGDIYQRSSGLFYLGRYTEMLAAIEPFCRSNLSDRKAHLLMAKAKLEIADELRMRANPGFETLVAEAHAIGKRFAVIDRNDPEVLYVLAKCLLLKNRVEKGERYARATLKASAAPVCEYYVVFGDAKMAAANRVAQQYNLYSTGYRLNSIAAREAYQKALELSPSAFMTAKIEKRLAAIR